MDDPRHTGRVVNQSQGGSPVEPREKVIGKQGFGYPDRAASCGASEPDTRAEDLSLELLAQVGGGDVFMFRLRTDTEPGQIRQVTRHSGQLRLRSKRIMHVTRVYGQPPDVKLKLARTLNIAAS